MPSQDALRVSEEGAGEVLEDADAPVQRLMIPVSQFPFGREFAELLPDFPQVFLEVIGQGQRLVELQGGLQPLVFSLYGIEILGVLEEQPASSLEDFLLQALGGLAVQVTPQLREFLVIELDDMEAVKDDGGLNSLLKKGSGTSMLPLFDGIS